MNEKPKTMRELLAYLAEHPKVTSARKRGQDGESRYEGHTDYRFAMYHGGGLWFLDENNKEHYLPVNCGMTDAETGIAFFPDRFEFTKFNITFAYYYGDIKP